MLYKALRLAREFNQINQKEMAAKLDISASYLSEIETGKKRPSLELLEKYSEIINVPASTFLLFVESTDNTNNTKRRKRGEKLLTFLEWVSDNETAQET